MIWRNSLSKSLFVFSNSKRDFTPNYSECLVCVAGNPDVTDVIQSGEQTSGVSNIVIVATWMFPQKFLLFFYKASLIVIVVIASGEEMSGMHASTRQQW